MAQRRMTSLEVIDTDAFLDMPMSSQLLYFHLNARADDDGFVANPKKVLRTLGGSSDDYKVLIAKKFLIEFEDGVCVIKHWRINNFIRKDLYKETKYLDLKGSLLIRPNGAYTLNDDGTALPVPRGHFILEDVNATLTERQLRIGKDRVGEIPAPEDGRRGTTPTFGGEEGIEPAPRAPRPVKTPVSAVIEMWNKYPNWKATGNRATPKNPSVLKELLPPARDVKALNGAILKKRSKYSEEDFDYAIRQYASEVANRNKDAKGYYLHRFTLYEFLTHHDIFERYVTK